VVCYRVREVFIRAPKIAYSLDEQIERREDANLRGAKLPSAKPWVDPGVMTAFVRAVTSGSDARGGWRALNRAGDNKFKSAAGTLTLITRAMLDGNDPQSRANRDAVFENCVVIGADGGVVNIAGLCALDLSSAPAPDNAVDGRCELKVVSTRVLRSRMEAAFTQRDMREGNSREASAKAERGDDDVAVGDDQPHGPADWSNRAHRHAGEAKFFAKIVESIEASAVASGRPGVPIVVWGEGFAGSKWTSSADRIGRKLAQMYPVIFADEYRSSFVRPPPPRRSCFFVFSHDNCF
jgi:hypothetical protein